MFQAALVGIKVGSRCLRLLAVTPQQTTTKLLSSKRLMKVTLACGLLFGSLFTLAGCKPAQQSSAAPADRGQQSATGSEQYNRDYANESHRHHHHRHGEADAPAGDQWHDAGGEDQDGGSSGAMGDDATVESVGSRSRAGHHSKRARTAAPGQFDFYVLNLSWSPEFCSTHASAAECAQHRAFTLHGLWPENNDGSYPEDCSDAPGPANPAQYSDIYPDPSLLEHEWQTHGTCSGLGPDAFLQLARRADQSIRVPAQLAQLKQQINLAPDAIVTLFTQSNPGLQANSVAISCGNNYLTAVEVCVDKGVKPQACSALKSCRANQVRIVPPQ